MKKKILTFGAPVIEKEEIEEVIDSLRSGWLGTGPKVSRFESEFAKYKGIESSVVAAVSSCTAALHLSILTSEIGPGDEIIVPAMTFCATVNAIIHAGATPVLADVDASTMNIDISKIEEQITPNTRAVIPVHFAGRCCDMDALIDITNSHGLKIIEDCAHAIESEYKGKKAGTFGDFGCFSFYVTKNMTTGEGGMVLAKSETSINRIKSMALHGMSHDAWQRFNDEGYKHYLVEECGYKYNMTDIQAAIGIHQLERIEKNWKRRKEIWDRYQDAFSYLPVAQPAKEAPHSKHAYHLYTLQIDKSESGIERDAFLDAMTKLNIGVGVHYLSIPEHPYYKKNFGWKPEDYPNAMRIGRQTVSLPLSANLTDNNVEHVIMSVNKILKAK